MGVGHSLRLEKTAARLASFYIKEPGNDLTVFALEARIGKLSEWKKLQGKQKT